MKKNNITPQLMKIDELSETAVHSEDMLELSASIELVMAQIDMSLKESKKSINELVNAMAKTAANIHEIKQQLPNIVYRKPTENETASSHLANNKNSHKVIYSLCIQTDNNIEEAVNAFQFYDRFTQRLSHIQESLQAIADISRSPDDKHPALWQEMHDKIRAVYTHEQKEQLLAEFSTNTTYKPNSNKTSESNSSNYGEVQLF